MPVVTTFCEFFGCSGGGPVSPPGNGNVANLLSVDYEDDWVYLEGIEDVGFAFGPDQVSPPAVTSGPVKVKRASPSHNEVIVAAATIGYEATDLTFVVFAETLTRSDGVTLIEPSAGDVIITFDYDWVIKSVRQNVDNSQWRCYCRRSVKP